LSCAGRPFRPGSARDDGFEILRGDDEGLRAGAIDAPQQGEQVRFERTLTGRVERGDRLVHWAVEAPEDVDEVLGRAIAERVGAARAGDRGGAGEERVDVR